MTNLSTTEALAKRQQLLRDGYCVVPGILHGDLLASVRHFTNEFLDTHAVVYLRGGTGKRRQKSTSIRMPSMNGHGTQANICARLP